MKKMAFPLVLFALMAFSAMAQVKVASTFFRTFIGKPSPSSRLCLNYLVPDFSFEYKIHVHIAPRTPLATSDVA